MTKLDRFTPGRASLDRFVRERFKSPSTGALTALAAAGVALAASAVLVRRRTRRTERNNPPTGRFVKVDGVHLHYIERGRGEPLVLLHGNATFGRDFDIAGLVDLAATHYRVIVFDRPGFGHSERPHDRIWTPEAQAALLHTALRSLGVEQGVFFGHSWGTQVALAMALNHPGMVKSLALASGYYYPSVRADVVPRSLPAVPVLGALLRHTISPWIGRALWPMIVRKLFSPSRVSREFSTRFPMWMCLRPSQLRAGAAEAALQIPSAISLSHRYDRLDIPVVLIAGEGDRVVSPDGQTARLHDALALSEMRLVPGGGHMIHHVQPHEVMLAIDRAAQASTLAEIRGVTPFGSQPKNETSNYVRAPRVAPDPEALTREWQE
jgi:pimeloyl-ACP methyl ester carboxylesterase